MMRFSPAPAGFAILFLAASAAAQSLGWRGDGTGRYPDARPPLAWDEGEERNILWQADAGKGKSTPIVVGDRVFLTAEPSRLICVDGRSGENLWSRDVGYATLPAELRAPEKLPKTAPDCGYASPTPASDGASVFVSFGTGVVVRYDLEGDRRWVRYLDEPFVTQYGRSASPILAAGKLIVTLGGWTALDPETGKTLWHATEAAPTYGTPVAVRVRDVDVILTSGGGCVRAADGKILASKLWTCEYSSPIVQDGVAYACGEGAMAMRLLAQPSGEIRADLAWRNEEVEGTFFASPLLAGGILYCASNEGTLYALDASSGQEIYRRELRIRAASGENGEPANIYPSPILAGTHILIGNDAGEMLIIAPGRTYRDEGVNYLDDGSGATPVAAGDRLFIRGKMKLSCIAAPARAATAADVSGAGVVVVEGGSSRHRIILEPSASGSEKHAAIEIQSHVEASTGAKLPIITGAPGDAGPKIVLGRGPIAASLGIAPSDEDLGEQGFALKTVGEDIVIAGTARAGTLHGARRFLEEELGIRWYAPGVTKIPHRDRFVVAPLDRSAGPAFRWREVSYAWPGGDAEFRSRRGLNSGGGGADDPLGEEYAFDGTCHSYFVYVSPDEFFDAHPEYFCEVNGRRIRDETQLCLTEPDVLEIVTERMLARMEVRPRDRQHNFSQMDWYNTCECERCRAVNARYGTAGGTQFQFVNRLAERTSAVHPEKLIGTLAYTYTEEPPEGLAMHPNVAVWLCHMFPSCDSHPIETCPRNADYRRRAEAWSTICSHLYIWHYVVNFAHYYVPFPNLRALSADMRFYRRLGVEGIFAQAMGHAGGGGEHSLLRGYYVSELLKDPERDPAAIVRDFLDGYYGAAADPIARSIALLHDEVEDCDVHMHLYTNPAQGYLTDEIMDRSEAFFDEAEAAVRGDETLIERVRVARMPLVYARFYPRNGYRIEEDGLVFRGPLAGPADAKAFVERMAKHGFLTIREQGGDPAQILLLAGVFRAPLPLITLRNEHLQVDVAPFLGGRVLRIIDRASGRSITAYDNRRNLLFPFSGGEESRVGGIFTIESGGSLDPAVPIDRTESSVTLAATIRLGYRVERTITLLPGRPALSIRVRATNLGDRPRLTRLRSHLTLDPGDVRQSRLRFKNRGGARVDMDLTRAIAGLREGERFLRSACPDGSWTFAGTNGLSVTQRFDPDAVEFTWVCAYPVELGELEVELWARETTLQPGESATFAHELEVRGTSPVRK